MSTQFGGKDKQRHAFYGARWVKARNHWLMVNPLCVFCSHKGIVRAASVVDHIVPHRGDYDRFWDMSNWQSLCRGCHDLKTRDEIAGRRTGFERIGGCDADGMPTDPRHPWAASNS